MNAAPAVTCSPLPRSIGRTGARPLVLALALAFGAPAVAADRYWACGSDWWDYTCWSATPGGAATLGQPLAGDNARLLSADIFGRTVSFWNTAYPSAVLNSLSLDGTGGGTMTLTQDRHTLAATDQVIGINGRAVYRLSAGTNQVVNQLTLGWYSGSNGSYELSGSGNLSMAWPAIEIIGLYGRGSFIQSGGTHSAGYGVTLGQYAGGQGSFTLSAGTLTMTGGILVGEFGSGSFTQSGGTHSAGGGLNLGRELGSTGSYMLSGGSVSATNQRIGYSGTGTFSQTGGANALANLYIGELNTGSGSYSLGGNGTLDSGVAEYVGYRGAGSFSQSAGTHTAHGELNVGWFSGSTGSYNLGGTGVLSAYSETIGRQGSGSFVQTGGTHTATGQLVIGDFSGGEGRYTLGAGSLTTPNLIVGHSGSGSFTQGGGSVTVGNSLDLGTTQFGGGTYLFNGGSISTLNEVIGAGGSASFTQAGGTHTVSNSFIVATGSYLLQAGSLTTTSASIGATYRFDSTFTQTGGTNVGTYETFISHDAPFGGNASYLHSGGTHSANTLYLGYMGYTSGTYVLSGTASLTAQQEYIGWGGGGGFVQSAGSHVVAGTLVLGHQVSGGGSYDLGGGSLRAATEIIGKSGQGSFAHSAGSNEVVNYFYLGELAGSQGSYALSGTGSLRAFTQVIGYYGHGSFTQSGGANVMISKLLIGYNNGSQGSYTHSAGSNRVNADLDMGFESGASGSYTLGGSAVLEANVERVGWFGSGSFTQTGGTNTVGTLLLGVGSGGSGSYAMSGGTLNVGVVTLGVAGAGSFAQGGGSIQAQSLTIARGSSYTLSGGTLSVAAGTSNAGILTLRGGHMSGALTNESQGQIAATGGTTQIDGTVLNRGDIGVSKARVVFAGGLTNEKAYRSDRSDNSFSELSIGEKGYLVGGAEDLFTISGAFRNASEQAERWDTRAASLALVGEVQMIELAGADLGTSRSSFDHNFAWGELSLAKDVELELGDGNATKGAALYVGVLELEGGLDQLRAIHSHFNIYYDPDLAGNAYLGGRNYALAGEGQLIAAQPVPEPESWAMLLAGLGVVGLVASRRRAAAA